MTFKELAKQKDFIASSNIEVVLYKLLVDSGVKRELIVGCKLDTSIGEAKENIYKEFSKLLGFEYYWEDYYHVKKMK